MPEIGISTTTIRRARGELPQMPLVNMFLEHAITEPRQFSLISHPGLVEQGTTLGVGPVGALYQADGIIGGDIAAVSAGRLWVGGVDEGSAAGDVIPSIAGNEIGIAATAGEAGAFFDGTDYSAIDFPDSANIRKIIEQGGRFIAIRDGTGAAYFTEILEDGLVGGVLTFDALNFFTAESEPDQLLDAVPFEDAIALAGTKTIEFWQRTGDSELPYTPSTGRVFGKGVRDTGCMALFDNSFAWVSPENIVYRAANVPERISDAGIEELIAASTTCRVDAYFFEGHEFLKVHLDDLAIEFDAQTRQWNERRTGTDNFKGGPAITVDSELIFGGIDDGELYELAAYADLGSHHERSFCVFQPVNGGALPINSFGIRTNPGHTDYLTGDYTDPAIEMFQSYDGGMTFDAALPEQLGEAGEYRREVEWRALGSADAPGFFAKIRVTDPVSFRCSGAFINEPHGGRSR